MKMMISGCDFTYMGTFLPTPARRIGIYGTTSITAAAESDDHSVDNDGRGFDAVETYMQLNGISTIEISSQDDRVASI